MLRFTENRHSIKITIKSVLKLTHAYCLPISANSDHHIDEETFKYAFKHGEPNDGVSGDDGGLYCMRKLTRYSRIHYMDKCIAK